MNRETPERTYLEAERSEELRRLVRVLPDALRDAVALRHAAGLSAKKIGRVIGKSEALREARDVDR